MKTLTDEDIRRDIAEFQERINTARRKLDQLPTGRLPYWDHRKRERKRAALQNEIKHVEQLISIAEVAL